MIVAMTEEQAHSEIIKWAKRYFRLEGDEQPPEVEVAQMSYNEKDEEWIATLQVSSSVDDPTIVFWKDDKYGLQIDQIDY